MRYLAQPFSGSRALAVRVRANSSVLLFGKLTGTKLD